MARHHATRDFFRQTPNPLLARYFHARGVFDDLDIAAMPEPQPDALWAAWLTLDDTQRHAMDAAFQDIAALSSEKGCRGILDEAAWHFASDLTAHAAFVKQLAARANHFERAMTTFLDHPACWRGATRFYQAEPLPAWRKRTHLPRVPAAVDVAHLQELAAGISTYFHHAEGRGTRCLVEPVRRGALGYSPTPRTTRSRASNGWTASSGSGRTIRPSRSSTSIRSRTDRSTSISAARAPPSNRCRACSRPRGGTGKGNLQSRSVYRQPPRDDGTLSRTRDTTRGTSAQ